jgi:hypothetical protein
MSGMQRDIKCRENRWARVSNAGAMFSLGFIVHSEVIACHWWHLAFGVASGAYCGWVWYWCDDPCPAPPPDSRPSLGEPPHV